MSPTSAFRLARGQEVRFRSLPKATGTTVGAVSSKHGETSELERDYDDGALICREGEASQEMFVIQTGKVRIFKQSGAVEVELAILDKADFFGEMSLLEGLPRDASAQALGRTRVLVMTAGALLVRLRRDPTFAFELLRRLSGRVRALNSRLLSQHADVQTRDETLLYQRENGRGSSAGELEGS